MAPLIAPYTALSPYLYIGQHPGKHAPAPPMCDVWVAVAIEMPPGGREGRHPKLKHARTIHVPLFDDARQVSVPREAEHVQRAAGAVAAELRAGSRVLVTCRLGLNRSALVVVLAMEQMGLPTAFSIAYLRQQRSPDVLSNTAFERYLRDPASRV